MKNFFILILVFFICSFAEEISFYDSDIMAGDTVTWNTGDTIYLSEKVFVESGALLNIEEGVVVKCESSADAEDAVALVICRGAKINATGSQNAPIIFTSASDDLYDPSFMNAADRGLWGGVVLLGNARNNQSDVEVIEGFTDPEDRGLHGGNNDEDNSGVLKYVSIRFGGTAVSANNELNGLSMGSVGSGTTIEHVEVYNNLDDGFEWWGGTVRSKYLVSAFCGDDAFDYDQGFRGRGQFWVALFRNDGLGEGDFLGEHDGANGDVTKTPFSIPVIANATYIGSGVGSGLFAWVDGAGGKYVNSIFFDIGATFNYDPTCDARREAGDLEFLNNIFYTGPGNTFSNITAGNMEIAMWLNNTNTVADPEFNKKQQMSPDRHGIDLRPSSEVAVSDLYSFSGLNEKDGTGHMEMACYKGAFDPTATENWLEGWTALDHFGVLAKGLTAPRESLPSCETAVEKEILKTAKVKSTPVITFMPVSNRVIARAETVEFFTIQGKDASSLFVPVKNDFKNIKTFNTSGIPKGSYVIRAHTNGGVAHEIIQINK